MELPVPDIRHGSLTIDSRVVLASSKDLWIFAVLCAAKFYGQATKSTWWMPWRREAMKDVASCDKPQVAANRLRSGDVRMGKPDLVKRDHHPLNA
jgi:hypothetical protein